MTIIEPNKTKRHINKFFVLSLGAMISVALWSIFVYNQTVTLGDELRLTELKTKEMLTQNAEFKNGLFKKTDTQNLKLLAETRGLIKVTSPEYFEVDKSKALAER